ncbi:MULTISPECIES: Rho-binding antiterminator [Enterobacterales]|jgi:Rho-binding antiterminator|uniref:Transcriptional antiterminator, Rof n=2 Tax=Pantoea TaxID=53335 RepID=A0A1I3Y0M5_9GAMM|nr:MULTISPECIES: Rho-binding antiterminator [Enterobacterales]MDY0927318.1 Rho-binding antiterminator [Enterobacter sp. CFBP8995]MRS20011.1 Rho-binding antiterminator [Enterobacteriaceae bacterium RIT692]MRT24106.1 Rho-binding antiterminator [Enterobacteriaceae bacterium RIT697]MRT40758.1 Rho-binding antiterminator [Enterobacteriaceae bacterium RIT702]KAJ9434145.1 Rho-binding antiterminator [Pantoea sp. YR343]
MLTNEAYKPINCDDYDNLELACQKNWTLSLELKNGDQLKAKAVDMVSRKNVEYLAVDLSGETREVRLDHIASFTHPELGTVVVSEDE